MSRGFNEDLLEDLIDVNMDETTTFEHLINRSSTTIEKILMTLKISEKEKASLKKLLQTEISKIYKCFDDFAPNGTLPLFTLVKHIRELDTANHLTFVERKLYMAISLGLIGNISEFKNEILAVGTDHIVLCDMAADRLNKLSFPASKPLKMLNNNSKWLGEALIMAKRNSMNFSPYRTLSKLNQLESRILEQSSLMEFKAFIEYADLRPSVIKKTASQHGEFNILEFTPAVALTAITNTSMDHLKSLMCMSRSIFPNQMAKAFQVLKMNDIFRKEDLEADRTVDSVIESLGKTVEAASRMTINMAQNRLGKEKMASYSLMQISRDMSEVTETFFNVWFMIEKDTKEYMDKVKVLDFQYLLRNYITTENIMAFQLRGVADITPLQGNLKGPFTKTKYFESIDYMMDQSIQTLYNLHGEKLPPESITCFGKNETKTASQLLIEWFGEGKGWWHTRFHPTVLIQFRMKSFTDLDVSFSSTLKEINSMLNTKYKNDGKHIVMFLNLNILPYWEMWLPYWEMWLDVLVAF